MSYEANYNTALTYIRSELKDRALESLYKAIKEVPESDKTVNNAVYLKILMLLAKLNLEKGDRMEAVRHIDEGLKVKNNHSDLLFLRALCFFDEKRFDEMFESMVRYLVSFMEQDPGRYEYEFTGSSALKETFDNLVPRAYKEAAGHKEMIDIIRRMAEKNQNELIQRAYEVMREVDAKRT